MKTMRVTRPGLLTPEDARVLRARSVILRAGEAMDWHTTGSREELLIALAGVVRVEMRAARAPGRSVRLAAGAAWFLPRATWHRLVNRSRRSAHYLYVTAPRSRKRAVERGGR